MKLQVPLLLAIVKGWIGTSPVVTNEGVVMEKLVVWNDGEEKLKVRIFAAWADLAPAARHKNISAHWSLMFPTLREPRGNAK